MPSLAVFTNKVFYHFFILAFLLGAQLYQSFFANITAVKALSRPQFRILQASIWPMYFKLQTVLCTVLAVTRPYDLGKSASVFRVQSNSLGTPLSHESEKDERWTTVVPLTAMVILAASNMLALVPITHRVIGKVHMISTREEKAAAGKQYSESPELKSLRRKFIASHGASYVFNMAVLLTTVWYAVGIADKCL